MMFGNCPKSENHQSKSKRAEPIKRREFLRLGWTGLAGLSLADLLRLRASASTAPARERTALIVVWLHGGASHLETYDPKPDAPSEYRGPFSPVSTRVPGLQLSELLPRHSEIANRFTILRSLVHTGFCHDNGPQQIFTGHSITRQSTRPVNPDLFSVAHYLRNDTSQALPNYVGATPIPYLGPAYLGQAHEPFVVHGDPNNPAFEVPNLGLKEGSQIERLNDRVHLRDRLDRLSRKIDQLGNMKALDAFQEQAFRVLTSSDARQAFDLNLENSRTRDFYGRNTWGQQCLLARRLVEAGVELVTTTLNGPLCGRVNNWDDHAVNHHVFDAMKARAPMFDQAVAALITDLHARGLDKQVLLIVGGDFGRTPRISYAADSATGVMQPGRDHWPNATSFLFSGGNIAEGHVIGATDRRGEEVVERRVGVGDFVATVYRHLGIDAGHISIPDFSGRPVPILPEGKPIQELLPNLG
jgi:Protein of unknown function (DUF1501)